MQDGRCALAILCCGTGVGMSMCANKMQGIRACCCSDTFSAEFTRRHNDANALCLGGRVVGAGLACQIVDAFLNAAFEGGRHQTRVDKMMPCWGSELCIPQPARQGGCVILFDKEFVP